MTPKANREKAPQEWLGDIERSVMEYDAWYLKEAPVMWVHARHRAVDEATRVMKVFDDLRDVSVAPLKEYPGSLAVLRMAVSPKMARDRFVEFAGVKKSLVERMERRNALPVRAEQIDETLQQICDFLVPLFDRELFPWVWDDRVPSAKERSNALLILGDRRAGALYDSELRNAQEARQKQLMGGFLESRGLKGSERPVFEMPPGSFAFGRNVAIPREGARDRNLPVDCVVAPTDASLPLVCLEMKSAGDYTNVNKRQKEEAEKHAALHLAHGDGVVFLLQLFGYFNLTYLNFEASAGIDWAWDHRLADLAGHFGLA